jgi:hypothetical protein
MIQMPPHYKVLKCLYFIDDIKYLFPDGKANELNWLLCSTSGVHGTYTTLAEIEAFYDNPEEVGLATWGEEWEEKRETYIPKLTCLVIQPRIACIKYGEIVVPKEDISYIRELISSSLITIIESQIGNIKGISNGDEFTHQQQGE